MPDSSTKSTFTEVGIALDREALRVHSHVETPQSLTGGKSEDEEERVDQYARAVAQLREGLGRR